LLLLPFVVRDNFCLTSSFTVGGGVGECLGAESSSTFSDLRAFGLRAEEFL